MSLYQRRIECRIDTLAIEKLNVEFEVEATATKAPNTLAAKIYNLSEATRNKIQSQAGDVRVLLRAGYAGERMTDLFLGDLRTVKHYRSGPDLVTEIEAGDGEKSMGIKFRKSYGKNTPLQTVLFDIAGALDVGVGNLATAAAIAEERGLASTFPNGVVVSGFAIDELSRLLASRGIDWSIQGSQIQILPNGQGLRSSAIELSPTSGLLGVPTVDKKGLLTCETLIIPDLYPGRTVNVKSEFVSGLYKVTKANYRGSLFGPDFNIAIEGTRLA